MKHLKQLLLSGCACLLACTGASATTIDFSTLAGNTSNSTVFTTYTEGGYTVTATSGAWNVNNSTFGAPIPSIFTSSGAGTVSVTRNAGTYFTFSGVDLGEYGGTGDGYTITGSYLGNTVFTLTGTLTSAFVDYGTAFSADPLSQLTIHFTDLDDNLDNIVVNNYTPLAATPEPGSLVLVLTGAAGVATTMLRRRMAAGLRG